MLVDDRVEWQHVNAATIDTPRCQLSLGLCGHALNSCERSGSVYDRKPTYIRARVSQKKQSRPWSCFLMHNPCLRGYILC